MDGKAFISYSRIDRPFAVQLATDLRSAGIDVWLDNEILGGVEWDEAVETSLNQCAAVILILTPASVASKAVKAEWSYALSTGRPVVPVLRTPCKPSYRLGDTQRIDFTSDYPSGLQSLLQALESLPASKSSSQAGVDSAGATHQTAGTAVLRPEPSPQRVIGAIYGAIGGSLFGAMTQWLLYHADTRRGLGGGGVYIAVVALGAVSAGLLWAIAGGIAGLRPKSLVWAAAAAAAVAVLWVVIFGTKIDVLSAAFIFGSPLAAVIAVAVQRFKTPAARAA